MRSIILASFGSADDLIRKNIFDKLACEIRDKFPEFEVRQAFTSIFMIKKLAKRGILIETPQEMVKKLRSECFERIIIMPTHLTMGEEFENKIKPCAAEDVEIIPPIMSDSPEKVLSVILKCFKREIDEDLILIGHGSPHIHNPIYEKLQLMTCERVHIGVIEPTDTPNFDNVVDRLRKSRAEKVLLAPLLFNGGIHVEEDIAVNWFDKLSNLGYKVRVIRAGLGTFEEFRTLYVKKLEARVWTNENLA